MTQPFFNVRTVVGLTGVVAWIDKRSSMSFLLPLMSFPRKRESRLKSLSL
ncbi:hypothetical protein [Rickettsia endosymbiont of Orchestes rusci]